MELAEVRWEPECRWPELAEPYRTALHEAIAYVFSRVTPLAIFASGTIIRGTPDATSDLDIFVLRDASERFRTQRIFNGVPAEIFVNPPARIERYFAGDRSSGAALTAHLLATAVPVYVAPEAADVVHRILTRAAEELASPPIWSAGRLTLLLYRAATWLEVAEDIADAQPELATAFLFRAVDVAIEHRFAAQSLWRPRPKDTLLRLEDADPDMAHQVRAFWATGDLNERRQLARQIVKQSTGETGFFEWESEPEA
jgi:hypothetical protein